MGPEFIPRRDTLSGKVFQESPCYCIAYSEDQDVDWHCRVAGIFEQWTFWEILFNLVFPNFFDLGNLFF